MAGQGPVPKVGGVTPGPGLHQQAQSRDGPPTSCNWVLPREAGVHVDGS